MASLKVEADEQAARADGAAVNQSKAGCEFLVVEIERDRANIAAVEFIAGAQLDVDRARDRVAGAARRRRTDDLDPVDQLGGNAVHEEAAVVVRAGDALAVDQYLRIAGRKAAAPRAVAFDDVRPEGHRRHALPGVAGGQGLAPPTKIRTEERSVGERGTSTWRTWR